MINYISKPFKWFFKLEAASGLVLLFAAILALIISNSNLSELYPAISASPIKSEKDLGMIVIDYLQLMQPHVKKQSREQEIAEISRGLKELAKELANSMETVNRLIVPKSEVSEKKAMEILSLRTEYDFKGEVFAPKNTDWTVIYSEEEGLANPCFSRVIFIRPIKNAEDKAIILIKKINFNVIVLLISTIKFKK